MLYTVYILYSSIHNKIYIGFTSNLLEWFKSHNVLGNKDWTIKFRPWKVIYCEYFADKTMAMAREKQLKSSKGREWIRHEINNDLGASGFISG